MSQWWEWVTASTLHKDINVYKDVFSIFFMCNLHKNKAPVMVSNWMQFAYCVKMEGLAPRVNKQLRSIFTLSFVTH